MAVSIAGVTRVRNEAHIVAETLEHYASFCDAGIFVLDDASEDETAGICEAHPAVRDLVRLERFNPESAFRRAFEGAGRQLPFSRALSIGAPDWILCFDADERADFDRRSLNACDGVRLRLFDFYITPEDVEETYHRRHWVGPEYRDILMLARTTSIIGFWSREPTLTDGAMVKTSAWAGTVRHYGKAISIEHWETKCEYYARCRPDPFSKNKWEPRRGRAVHDGLSDFGNRLIPWQQRELYGFPLEDPCASC